MIIYEPQPLFRNRADAGKHLAERLSQHYGIEVIVFAIPRGGVPVAIKVAKKLEAPLDIVVPCKITIPHNPEAGYGAVTEDGTTVLNEPLVRRLGLTKPQIERQAREVRAEIERRSAIYRDQLLASPVDGKTAIIIDDSLASGFTIVAAVKSIKRRKAARIVVAVPIASGTAYDLIKPLADDLVCLFIAHSPYFAVASFYQHWYDLTDEEAINYLTKLRTRHPQGGE